MAREDVYERAGWTIACWPIPYPSRIQNNCASVDSAILAYTRQGELDCNLWHGLCFAFPILWSTGLLVDYSMVYWLTRGSVYWKTGLLVDYQMVDRSTIRLVYWLTGLLVD